MGRIVGVKVVDSTLYVCCGDHKGALGSCESDTHAVMGWAFPYSIFSNYMSFCDCVVHKDGYFVVGV